MRQNFIIGLAAAVALSACGPTDHRAVSGPQFDHVQDLDGTPDLIVDGQRLADSWVIYDQTFSTNACSVVEGGVAPGEHRVLRFTVTPPTSAMPIFSSAIPTCTSPPTTGCSNSRPAITITTSGTTPLTSSSRRTTVTFGAPPSGASA